MLLEDYKISPTVQLIEYVKLIGVPSFSSKNSSKPFLEIYSMRDLEKVIIYDFLSQKYYFYRNIQIKTLII